MQKVLEMATDMVEKIPAPDGGRWVARTIADGKLRTFIPPGDRLEFEARVAKHEGDALVIAVVARKDNRVTGNSKIIFSAEAKS